MKLTTVFIIHFIICLSYQNGFTKSTKQLSSRSNYPHGAFMQMGSFPEEKTKRNSKKSRLHDDDEDRIDVKNEIGHMDQVDNSQQDYYNVYLDSSRNLYLRWKPDYDEETVLFTIDAISAPARWIAIGFSDYGNETGADLCVLWWDHERRPHFQDVWTDEQGIVHLDLKQDCKLLELERRDNHYIFTYSRQFDTCDDGHDYVLDEGTVHIIYATDDGPIPHVAGLSIPDSEHGFQRTQLLKVPTQPVTFPRDTRTFAVLSNKVRVPNVETTYWCHVVKVANMNKNHHVVQFEAVIQEGNEALVHHMEVFHCEVEMGVSVPLYDGACNGPDRPKTTEACKKVIAAWAMGAQPFVYPKEAGLPIGGPKYSPYVMLEVHYNNPGLRDDYVDSSGIKFYYTSQLRQHEAAVLEIGLEYTSKMAIPPHQEAFSMSGHCIVECTEVSLPPRGIILFAAQLHTHLTGKQVYVKHYRGGMELQEMARDDHYSPHFQEIRTLRNRVLLLPGDALVATCTYDTSQRTNITLGGFSISEEMCVSYIHYFPKSNLEVCKSSIDSDVLDSYFQFQQEYEDQPTSPQKSVGENYQSITWTPLRAQILHQLYSESTLSMQCNQSSGDRFPGYWNNMLQTIVQWPQPPKPRLCDDDSSEYNLEGEDNDDI